MFAEIRRGEDGLDLNQWTVLVQRSSRTKVWNNRRSSRVIGPGRPAPITRPSHSTTGISSGGRTREEAFVGVEHVEPVHRPLDHGVSRPSGPAR